MTGEARDYFQRRENNYYQIAGYSGDYRQLRLAQSFSYSTIWMVYGVGLMVLGFWKRSAFVRWQALVLIAITIGKVFSTMFRELGEGYRILSFIALGAVLFGISFIYQRDWLKLSSHSSEKSTETPA